VRIVPVKVWPGNAASVATTWDPPTRRVAYFSAARTGAERIDPHDDEQRVAAAAYVPRLTRRSLMMPAYGATMVSSLSCCRDIASAVSAAATPASAASDAALKESYWF